MIGYADEEAIDYWTRGDLHGEWHLSDTDIEHMFMPYELLKDSPYSLQKSEFLYSGSDTMKLHMTSYLAPMYNLPYRMNLAWKARTIPWATNMLNAYHNLHFICYMADKVPDFNEVIEDGKRTYCIGIPGMKFWLLELLLKAATDCLRDDFIKAFKEDDPNKYRVTPMTAELPDDSVGFNLHITGDCLINLWITFMPTVKEDGTFGCQYKVEVSAENWRGNPVAIYGKNASSDPLRQNMLNMYKYVKKELKQFSKMLDKAEFNQPEYALKRLNGKEIG